MPPENPRSEALRNAEPAPVRVRSDRWNHTAERQDPDQRFFVYLLCDCDVCDASGKVDGERCPDCRGEGRTQDLRATCATEQAVGVTICTLGREGELDDCPCGILDTQGEPGQKWILKPWRASPREVSDAGRVLAKSKGKGKP